MWAIIGTIILLVIFLIDREPSKAEKDRRWEHEKEQMEELKATITDVKLEKEIRAFVADPANDDAVYAQCKDVIDQFPDLRQPFNPGGFGTAHHFLQDKRDYAVGNFFKLKGHLTDETYVCILLAKHGKMPLGKYPNPDFPNFDSNVDISPVYRHIIFAYVFSQAKKVVPALRDSSDISHWPTKQIKKGVYEHSTLDILGRFSVSLTYGSKNLHTGGEWYQLDPKDFLNNMNFVGFVNPEEELRKANDVNTYN